MAVAVGASASSTSQPAIRSRWRKAAASGNGTGSLTRDQFHELLKAHDVPVGNVLMAAEEIYGRKFGFDDEERAVLWDALRPA